MITIVAQAVRDGDLRQVASGATVFGADEDILAIVPEGPWPDYLKLHFVDTRTGMRFKLTVETYHGSGGSWGPMEPE
ncbi:MAG: hypothetical protein IT178_06495 [Acidobacteria bacterium]|nr:hypothetical protein [Acidobacteriota bacterium]